MLSPNFSESKLIKCCLDIVDDKELANKFMFHMILGVEIMVRLGVLLHFSKKINAIDHIENLRRPL